MQKGLTMTLFPTLPTLPPDKLGHYAYSTILFLLVATPLHLLGVDCARYVALTACLAAGAYKELTDWIANRNGGTHEVSFYDFLATALGGCVCFLSGM